MNGHGIPVTTRRLAVAAIVALASAAGCAAPFQEDAAQNDAEMKLVAQLSMTNGNVVEFYDDGLGEIVVSETGPIENPFSFSDVDLALRSPQELWIMAGGAEASTPQPLRDATARRNMQTTEKVGTTQQALSNGAKLASCADAAFFARGGPNTGGMLGTRIASDTDLVTDKEYYRFTLCVHGGQSGGVSMDAHTRPWWDWKKYGYWVTSSGYFRWWAHQNSSVDFDARTRFWNGSGLKIDHFTNCMPSGYNCWH